MLLLLIVAALGIARVRNLFAVVALGGVYSFLMALALLVLDAVDVSMTEASVGAGISTVLLLGALYLTKIDESPPLKASVVPLLFTLATGAALLYGTWGLPSFGDPAGPIHTHVAPRYLIDVVGETGVPNAVTAVLASYRGYDTLGETTVIFTAGIAVLVLLAGKRRMAVDEGSGALMRHEIVPRVVIKLLLPFILLFATYVLYHGELGPGGGFQAGVIIAACFILFGLIFGLAAVRRVVPMRIVEIAVPLGVFIYGSVGVCGLVLGGHYLDYFVLDRDPVHGQERGIFWVEVGVTFTVAATMTAVYYAFSGRGRGR